MSNRWGIWAQSQPGCEPPDAGWWGSEVMSEELARAVAETCNRVNGKLWAYEAREMPESACTEPAPSPPAADADEGTPWIEQSRYDAAIATLRALVEAMPKCRHKGCGAPGTFGGDGAWMRCDEHREEGFGEQPYAVTLRAAITLLAPNGGTQN
jgi:hypothetical protein